MQHAGPAGRPEPDRRLHACSGCHSARCRPHDLLYRLRGARQPRAAWPASSTRRCATSGRSWSSTRSTRACAGDVRYRLVQRLLRDASKRGGLRFHVACADDGDNVELFMQAGFARYGEEMLLYRPPDQPLPDSVSRRRGHDCRHPTRRAARRAGARPAVPPVPRPRRWPAWRTTASTTGSARATTGACHAPR